MRGKKKIIKKKEIRPDPKYSSILVQRLINKFMLDGHITKARSIVYKAAALVENDLKLPFLTIFEKAIENIKPGLELRTRKVGGGRQRNIIKISPERNITLALTMLKNIVREESKRHIFLTLSSEIKNAYQGKGSVVKRKENIIKEAEVNRTFSVI